MSSDSPKVDLSLLKAGDRQAFDELYTSYWEVVYLHALKRTRDEDAAKEITQELFIHIWEKRTELNIISIHSYLYGAVRFRVINYFKSAITRQKYHDDLISLLDGFETADIESKFALDAMSAQLENILMLMPLKMRRIFSMSRLEQKSVSEIAGELELSDQTVKNQLSAALKIIRKSGSFQLLLFCAIFY